MNDLPLMNVAQRRVASLLLTLVLMAVALDGGGCNPNPGAQAGKDAQELGPAPTLTAVDLSNPIEPVTVDQPVHLHAAANEWTSFTVQVSGVSSARPVSLKIVAPPQADGMKVYQVLAMPIEVNPGYVRHTGLNTANRSIPRALLPVALENGAVSLGSLRATQPTNPAAHPNGNTVLLWVDLHVPTAAQAGDYHLDCELLDRRGQPAGDAVPVKLTVYDFALPQQRHLNLIGRISWDRLAALYPDLFGDTITPSLINRRNPVYERTVKTLDELMALAEGDRTQLIVPGLRPTVKWPSGQGPQIDWRDFDSLLQPWMRGETFADGVPLPYWPIPPAENLERYDLQSRLQYWSEAADHFGQREWLGRSAVDLDSQNSPAGEKALAALAAEASQILSTRAGVRVMLPLGDEQISAFAAALTGEQLNRVLSASPGLISSAHSAPITAVAQTAHPHWLRTNEPGFVPYAGAGGDERDVRTWAWLAFLRRADFIVFDSALPAVDSASQPADPSGLVWFYPGRWFGVDQPVPTIQLKWLRRAQQDFEYLWLAKDRGEVINALQMARLITKPVEIQPGQQPDPVYSLMSGTSDERAWDEARLLLARTILLRKPGEAVDESRQRALYLQTLQWAEPQERPLLLARSAQWRHVGPRKDAGDNASGDWLHLELGLDIYNASDNRPDRNALRWAQVPPDSGWEVRPQPLEIPRLQTYHVQPATMSADFDLNRIGALPQKPVEIGFINGFTKAQTRLKLVLPVAISDRREGPMALDGNLSDWTDSDAIQNGPLVLMMNRPDLQKQQIRFAPVAAKLYSAWGRDNFYLAFALEGLSPESRQAHNDVYYQARRAWGEDLCEALIQPVFADNSTGPVLHVVCKPNGADWVELKPQASASGKPASWQPAGGSSVRYATTSTPQGRWHGELAVPWKLLRGDGHDLMPVLLRFNFVQHRASNCESASWAGPVDFGRDENLTGILYLRTPLDLGIAGAARQE